MSKKQKIPRDASPSTIENYENVKNSLDFNNKKSFDLAGRGLKHLIPYENIYYLNNPDERVVWNPNRYKFVKGEAPYTVNPSLWRQSKLTNIGGLFEVVPGIYQVRNYDLANLTIIESKNGIIITDVLTCAETAQAALNLYFEYKNNYNIPIVAVIITHSHIDHFAGLLNDYITLNNIKNKTTAVYVPDGFVQAVYMENFYMGNVMGRRASYMYGNLLPADSKGSVGAGLGTTKSTGSTAMIPPELLTPVKEHFEKIEIDNLSFEFQLVPGTEAPAEMHFFIKDYSCIDSTQTYNVLCTAENAVHNMHNVYSLRGAQIRDALSWSQDINQALYCWGGITDVLIGVHHWPVWDNDKVITYLKKQRDCYRYINDQTLRLANLGYKPIEIAEILKELPGILNEDWDLRGYYGSLNHNVKSVFVKHIGWFNGNPATLHTLPPAEAGAKYIEYMGGTSNLLKKAIDDYNKGEYRWVAEVLNHLIFAKPFLTEPSDRTNYEIACQLMADTLEQLGYQAESGPWRNFYLSGAQELRQGVDPIINSEAKGIAQQSFLDSCPLNLFYDYMGLLLIGHQLKNEKAVININTLNSDDPNYSESFQLVLENCVLNHTIKTNLANPYFENPNTTVSVERSSLYLLITKIASGENPTTLLNNLINNGEISIEGDQAKFELILNNLQVLNPNFNIVQPVSD